MRGEGVLETRFVYGEEEHFIRTPFASEDWSWIHLPFPRFSGFQDTITTRFFCTEGTLELDAALMMQSEPFTNLDETGTHFLPAPTLFHAGHTDLEQEAVILTPSHVPYDEVVYGPRHPLPPGRYRATLELESDQTAEVLGEFRLRDPGPDATAPIPVWADRPAELEFTITHSLPAVFAFRYFRNASLAIKGIRVERLPEAP
jgi:hypothetical protein